ncbi:fibroblast growth factor 19 [Amia ocellicauda]|uniref:fibroblast growth factor 19 n=1 Tax=Amia ocellicauda TaxID=2972642 RepID=UPI0034641538|nr:FGF19 factor [Amia calva]
MRLSVCITISVANLYLALVGHCLPLPDPGPHISNGWGKPVRFRHLYSAHRHGLLSYHLQINQDGRVDGTIAQSPYSLLEIRPVDTGFVVIKGVASSQYLCMEENGKLYGSHIYAKDDCSFIERILPDGYNVYESEKYKTAVSLSSAKQRLQAKDRGLPPLSQFLPMVSTIPVEPMDGDMEDFGQASDQEQGALSPLETDSMDPFGNLSRIFMQSPSFHIR